MRPVFVKANSLGHPYSVRLGSRWHRVARIINSYLERVEASHGVILVYEVFEIATNSGKKATLMREVAEQHWVLKDE